LNSRILKIDEKKQTKERERKKRMHTYTTHISSSFLSLLSRKPLLNIKEKKDKKKKKPIYLYKRNK